MNIFFMNLFSLGSMAFFVLAFLTFAKTSKGREFVRDFLGFNDEWVDEEDDYY